MAQKRRISVTKMTVPVVGGEMDAAMYVPSLTPAPGVVLLQEVFGVNEFVSWISKRLSDEGFLVIAPDLYHRIEAGISLGYDDASRDQALKYYSTLDQAAAQNDAEAAIVALRGHPSCTGRVAAVGFCLGGKNVLKAAAARKLNAGVAFYPVEVPTYREMLKDISCPVQIHLGGEDPHSPEETRRILSDAVSGLEGSEYYLHPGGQHGFFNPFRDAAYHPEATDRAFADMVRFLRSNL